MGQTFKKIIIIIIIIFIVLGTGVIIYPYLNYLNGDSVQKQISIYESSNPNMPFTIEDKGIKIKVTIVETEEQRQRGLSGTTFLDDNNGMLFIFDSSGYYEMWMKDMLFPLDIIWLDSSFNVVDIKKNLTPDTYPQTFGPKSKALYVLEINSGIADKYGFNVGDKFKVSDQKTSI